MVKHVPVNVSVVVSCTRLFFQCLKVRLEPIGPAREVVVVVDINDSLHWRVHRISKVAVGYLDCVKDVSVGVELHQECVVVVAWAVLRTSYFFHFNLQQSGYCSSFHVVEDKTKAAVLIINCSRTFWICSSSNHKPLNGAVVVHFEDAGLVLSRLDRSSKRIIHIVVPAAVKVWVAWDLNDGLDVGEVGEARPPLHRALSFRKLHDGGVALVPSGKIEDLGVSWVNRDELRVFPTPDVASLLGGGVVVEFVAPVNDRGRVF